jgi:hypothetical protein
MKTRAIASLAGLGGVLIMSNTSSAAYQGLTVRLHTTAPVNGINRDVWRVYAMFSDPGDFLVSVAGSPTLGNLVLQSLDVFGNPGGGNFVNPAGGGATAPSFNQVGTQVEWDTFVTIGLAYAPDGFEDLTRLSPGFNGIGSVPSINSNNLAWFLPGVPPQGLAANGVADINGMGNWGVLMKQLTVNAGNGARGTVAVGGVNNDALAGGTTFQTVANQTFTTHPPAPASIGLLGIAGFIGQTRRRNCA